MNSAARAASRASSAADDMDGMDALGIAVEVLPGCALRSRVERARPALNYAPSSPRHAFDPPPAFEAPPTVVVAHRRARQEGSRYAAGHGDVAAWQQLAAALQRQLADVQDAVQRLEVCCCTRGPACLPADAPRSKHSGTRFDSGKRAASAARAQLQPVAAAACAAVQSDAACAQPQPVAAAAESERGGLTGDARTRRGQRGGAPGLHRLRCGAAGRHTRAAGRRGVT